jgi:hypothetical protein
MKITTCGLLAVLVVILLPASNMQAAPIPVCVAGPVSTIAATTCSIGNLEFIFGTANVVPGSRNVSPSSITFTPDAADNGFMLSGMIADTAPSPNQFDDQLVVNFNVATLSHLASITGVTAGFTGTGTGPNGILPFGTPFASFYLVDLANSSNIAEAGPGVGFNGCGSGPTASPCTRLFNVGPVAQTGGMSGVSYGIFGEAQPGFSGTASITSATYFVDESSPAIPEPASVGLTIVGLAFLIRRAMVAGKLKVE